MPYVVTTRRPCPACTHGPAGGGEHRPGSISRQAVATLEEARTEATDRVTAMYDALVAVGHDFNPRMRDLDFYGDCARLSESGGTVGPLPDGTVIQVGPLSWFDLAERVRGERLVPADHAGQLSLIAAFNAREVA